MSTNRFKPYHNVYRSVWRIMRHTGALFRVMRCKKSVFLCVFAWRTLAIPHPNCVPSVTYCALIFEGALGFPTRTLAVQFSSRLNLRARALLVTFQFTLKEHNTCTCPEIYFLVTPCTICWHIILEDIICAAWQVSSPAFGASSRLTSL